MIRLPRARNTADGQKWYPCRLCGTPYSLVEIKFNSGSTEPVEDETLTGATSGATCVVDEVNLTGGTWAGGDAEGFILATAPAPIDFDTGHWGSEDEDIGGSTAGNNCLTMDGYGYEKRLGRYYPEDEIVEASDGYTYCKAHYDFRFGWKEKDEFVMDIDEGDRE